MSVSGWQRANELHSILTDLIAELRRTGHETWWVLDAADRAEARLREARDD